MLTKKLAVAALLTARGSLMTLNADTATESSWLHFVYKELIYDFSYSTQVRTQSR